MIMNRSHIQSVSLEQVIFQNLNILHFVQDSVNNHHVPNLGDVTQRKQQTHKTIRECERNLVQSWFSLHYVNMVQEC